MIATKFCTCHHSLVVVTYAKFSINHLITIWITENIIPIAFKFWVKLHSDMPPGSNPLSRYPWSPRIPYGALSPQQISLQTYFPHSPFLSLSVTSTLNTAEVIMRPFVSLPYSVYLLSLSIRMLYICTAHQPWLRSSPLPYSHAMPYISRQTLFSVNCGFNTPVLCFTALLNPEWIQLVSPRSHHRWCSHSHYKTLLQIFPTSWIVYALDTKNLHSDM